MCNINQYILQAVFKFFISRLLDDAAGLNFDILNNLASINK